MDEILIVVDGKDNFVRYAHKEECHTGEGLQHRAFVTLLFNKDKKILLQKRKHKLWDNFWDLTACSHPQHLESENRDESYEEATARCLKREWGISMGPTELENILAFNYFSPYTNGKCENEHCALLVGEYSGELTPNYDECYGFEWTTLGKLIEDIEKNPGKFVPWAFIAVKELKNHPFAKGLL